MSRVTQYKPPRLRDACLGCTSAKVKCSGEKTGCNRCTKNDLECVFLESMAGRVPRQARKQAWITFDGAQTCRAQQNKSGSDSKQGLHPRMEAALPPVFENFILTDRHDFHKSDTAMALSSDQSLMHPCPISNIAGELWPCLSPTEREFANMFPSYNGYLNNSDASVQSSPGTMSSGESTLFSMSSAMMFGEGSSGRQLDKKCVTAATQIINVLEDTIGSPSQSLDVVLEIVRKASVGLNALIDLQQQGVQQRCLALFGAILHQILDHLETQVHRIEVDGTGVEDTLPSACNMSLHRLDSINELISTYQADPCPLSATTARARMLLVEVDASLQTAFRVMELAERAGGSAEREKCWSGRCTRSDFENIQMRLELLRMRLSIAMCEGNSQQMGHR